MLLRLLLLFSLVPVVEIWLIIRIGHAIGAIPTVTILLTVSLAGAWLARAQGFAVLRRVREDLAAGRLPAAGLLDGSLVLVGGVLLMTPGFFTDFVGLFFLFPPTRALLKRGLRRRLERALAGGTFVIRRF